MALTFEIGCPECAGPLELRGRQSVSRSGRASDAFVACAGCGATHHVTVSLFTLDRDKVDPAKLAAS